MRVISAHASVPYDLGAMLAQADYAVVLVPLTPKTRGMIGPRELAGMKKSAVLIVMSRGGIVDESALGAALRANALRGAALDVFDEEPLPKTSPVWDTPRLVITPHVAGLTHDYIRRVTRVALDNVARIERGEPPTTLISAARGYCDQALDVGSYANIVASGGGSFIPPVSVRPPMASTRPSGVTAALSHARFTGSDGAADHPVPIVSASTLSRNPNPRHPPMAKIRPS